MNEQTLNLIIGLVVSLIGALLTIYAFNNQPDKKENEFSKAANIQLKILGISLFIGGLIYAF